MHNHPLFLFTQKNESCMFTKSPAGLSAFCGSLLSIVVALDTGDLLKSCVLTAMGTAVSYAMSRMLKALFERKKNEPDARKF
jgi:hypothetical protein